MKSNLLYTSIYNKSSYVLLVLSILTYLAISVCFDSKLNLILGLLPIAVLAVTFGLTKPIISLSFVFAVNYLIMGANRYINIPIPITNIFDILFSIIISFILIRQIYLNDDFSKALNLYTLFTLIWLLYCIINIGNNVTGEIHFEPWLRKIRPIAFYPLITCLIISITAKRYTFIYYFLIIFSIFSLFGASRGIWQKVHGFDSYELAWVTTAGASTHLIHSGIRYFSFFTDAANFGCSMGFSFVVCFISSLFVKNKILKIFLLVVCGFTTYGLLISGTRASIAVPFAGMALFTILAKNWKLIMFSMACLLLSFIILKFTTIGDSNQFIKRMRTVFDTEDASFQVRLNNQKALRSYMSEAPFGIGIGVENNVVPVQNKFYFVSVCPPDSDLVYIWIHLGIIGLIIYLIIQFLVYSVASFILLFRIKNPEIRGPLTGMLCGSAGVLVASYANQISFQFPNGIIMFTCITLVYLGPYFDKQYSKEHERK